MYSEDQMRGILHDLTTVTIPNLVKRIDDLEAASVPKGIKKGKKASSKVEEAAEPEMVVEEGDTADEGQD